MMNKGKQMSYSQGSDSASYLHTGLRMWPSKRYAEMHLRSLQDPEGFWSEEARKLDWYHTWDRVLDWNPPYARWFVGGRLNACYQCVDRHVKTWRRSKVAIYLEGEPGETRVLSYSTLFREVNRFASALKQLGVKKGDRIALYLPMVPELPIFMLACARIGAVHTVIFSGFSAEAIADRINDTQAKAIVTADGGYRRGRMTGLKEIADEAANLCPSVEKIIVVKRTGEPVPMTEGRDLWLSSLLDEAEMLVKPEPMESTHPLYILYTSGTTGKPKGVIHGTGGYLVFNHSAYQWVFDIREESVYWCTADLGWVTGHSSIVYAPLSHGAAIVLYEGAPDYPAVDRWWFYQCAGGVPEDTTGVYSEEEIRNLLTHLETIFDNRWYVKHGNTTNRCICANLLLGGVQNTVGNIMRLASNISRLGGIAQLGRQTRDSLRNVRQCLDTILELEVLGCFAEERFPLRPYPLLNDGKRPDAKVIVDETEIFIEVTAVNWPRLENFPGFNWKSKQGSKIIEKSINEVSQLPRSQCGAVVVNPPTLIDEEMGTAIMEAMQAYLSPDLYTRISGIMLTNKRIERSGFLKACPIVLVNTHACKRCDSGLLRLAEALYKHPSKPGVV